ncbi:hypothetical protein KP509_21G064000 [Ceratopteris richardii]|uniref:Gamma-glutamylcyclotransferase AIG2-like domain-containing protein n=1 Tax=Ceratopteris richardii TaxID=49495 RepID=A0A8T2SDS6_CERRI|nr:hypothetical protein KP509_21G064000 [Ceratopteris richardii]
MGQPLPDNVSSSSPLPASAEAKQAASCNGDTPTSSSVQHVFVYGNSRPDISPPFIGDGVRSSLAWLLGGRLYSCNSGGVHRPVLRLDEAGHAVCGYAVSVSGSGSVIRLLDALERREHSPDFYEREVVEVVTEGGQRVQSYVYHCQEIDRSHPVQGGDWLQHLNQ